MIYRDLGKINCEVACDHAPRRGGELFRAKDMMAGADTLLEGMLNLTKLDDFVPANPPLRVIRTLPR